MNKKIKIVILFLLVSFIGQANTIDVYWNIKRYYQVTEKVNYIELYYLVPSNIVSYKNNIENNTWQANLKIDTKIYNQQDSLISQYAYLLNSPTYTEITSISTNLSDLIRIKVAEDSLKVHFQIIDQNDSTLFYSDLLDVTITDHSAASISDISLLNEVIEGEEDHPFYRNGKVMIPKFLSYYPSEISTINFYTEFYQPNTNDNYLLKYFIADENRFVLEKYMGTKKIIGKDYDALLTGFDISTLASGNYYIYVEVRDTSNTIVHRKRVFFQRSNTQDDITVENHDYNELSVITDNFARKYDLFNILHHTKALKPLANELEQAGIDGVLSTNDLTLIQNYFYTFWKEKDKQDPEAAWNAYAEKLQYVENQYSTSIERGFETDRGVIYLKYGAPDDKNKQNRNKAYGNYEIWTYNNLPGYGIIDFVFANTDEITDDYTLVHSNLKGEIYNAVWADLLKSGDY